MGLPPGRVSDASARDGPGQTQVHRLTPAGQLAVAPSCGPACAAMLELVSAAAAVVALGFTLYLASAHWLWPERPVQLAGCRRALLVCAHPDDECMFFGPAVIGLQRHRHLTLYLLCLSTGEVCSLLPSEALWCHGLACSASF